MSKEQYQDIGYFKFREQKDNDDWVHIDNDNVTTATELVAKKPDSEEKKKQLSDSLLKIDEDDKPDKEGKGGKCYNPPKLQIEDKPTTTNQVKQIIQSNTTSQIRTTMNNNNPNSNRQVYSTNNHKLIK